MKATVFAILLVIAGAFASPQFLQGPRNEEGVVVQRIREAVERVRQGIKDRGLDPVKVDVAEYERIFAPSIIEIAAAVEEFSFSGLSDIEINSLAYAPYINRLTFDLSMPEIKVSIGKASANLLFFTRKLDAEAGGSFAIRGLRVAGEINFNLSIIDGITVRSITIDFFAGVFASELSLVINNNNFSDNLNYILGVRIPGFLDDNRNEINRSLENVIRILIDELYN